MLIHGALGYSENPENTEDFYLVITIIGAILFALSILLFGKYVYFLLILHNFFILIGCDDGDL